MYKNYDKYFFILIFLIIFCEITAQYLFKKPVIIKHKNLSFIVGIILYSIIGLLAYQILQYGEIGVINIVWHLLHFIILFIVGYLFLDEKLSFKKTIACILGLISLTIFLLEDEHH